MPSKHEFQAIGTHWVIDIGDDLPRGALDTLMTDVHTRIADFDKNYSRFRPDSLVSLFSREAGTYDLPADAPPMFELYYDLYRLTGGMFTPLIGQTLVDAGYDSDYSLKPKVLSRPPTWEVALEYSDGRLVVKQPVLLDLGAAGKGYLVDIVSDLLLESGVESFSVDAGGDMHYHTHTSATLRVGLEHPLNTKQVIGVASILNQSICGSSGNRRKWREFTHVINPVDLRSPEESLAIWTIANTTMLADAVSTCLSFVKPDVLLAKYSFEYFILYPDFTFTRSVNFPAELFLS